MGGEREEVRSTGEEFKTLIVAGERRQSGTDGRTAEEPDAAASYGRDFGHGQGRSEVSSLQGGGSEVRGQGSRLMDPELEEETAASCFVCYIEGALRESC